MDRQHQSPHEEPTRRRRQGSERPEDRPPETTAGAPPQTEPVVEEADWPAEPAAPQSRPPEMERPRQRPPEERHASTVIVEEPAGAPRPEVAVIRGPRPVVDRVTMAVDYLFFLLYGLLGIRFLLSLMGASETAGFVQLIHTLTAPFYAPFQNIVTQPALEGGFLDYPILIALLAYGLLHIAARGLVRVIAGERRAA